MTTILILAAGNISSKFSYIKPNYSTAALMPVNSKSVIKLILDFYSTNVPNSKVYIAANQENVEVINDEINLFTNVEIIAIPPTDGVNSTIKYCLNHLPDGQVIINLGTTIPVSLIKDNTAFISNELEHNRYYSSVTKSDEAGYILNLKKDNNAAKGYPFTGVFSLQKDVIAKAISTAPVNSDLLAVLREAVKYVPVEFVETNWIDIGHEINYFKSRKKIIFSRSFNSLQMSDDDSYIIKKSNHTHKFKNEVDYVDMLPSSVRSFYPKIVEQFQINNNTASVGMEYFAYPNISEYQLYWALDPIYWERIFDQFYKIFSTFKQNRFSIGKKAHTEFYYAKTIERYNQFKAAQIVNNPGLFGDQITLNFENIKGFEVLQDSILQKIEIIYNEDDFCIMHGDPCFNNVLYDYVSDTIKLIDPRGSFGERCVGIYGDIKYDIAKFAHSSIFGYDYIVNDLYTFDEGEDGWYKYSFKHRSNQQLLDELTNALVKKLGYHSKDIYFIVGLLFISMCALHTDNIVRQKIMYLHGLKLINENLV